MPKLTKRFLEAIKPDQNGKDVFAWDRELRGFGLRLKPSGAGSYVVQYRTAKGATRRYAFAQIGTLTPDQARTRAKGLLATAEAGGDPSAQRHEAREALTVAELCDQYMQAARAGLTMRRGRAKAPSTIRADQGRVVRHIVPLIGRLSVKDLDRAAVVRMSDAITAGKTAGDFPSGRPHGLARVEGGPAAAARVIGLFGAIWRWGEKRGLVERQNPGHGVEKHKGEPRDRVLAPAELAALGAAMRACEGRPEVSVLRLIALTGLRRQEATCLRWAEIDALGQCLRLEASKTGRSIRPIGKTALLLLERLPRNASEWVFPRRNMAGPAELEKAIARLFNAAGLADARSHDLRRTFASTAADLGFGDSTIAELLGHAARTLTHRHYIRRLDSALIAAADRTAGRLAIMLDGKSADVLPFIHEDAR
jgi:integrase